MLPITILFIVIKRNVNSRVCENLSSWKFCIREVLASDHISERLRLRRAVSLSCINCMGGSFKCICQIKEPAVNNFTEPLKILMYSKMPGNY
uniref:Uncharacterized protein n=1 Tax=Mastacembelus armatus TaxID=205130 RepID=A0A3Q3KT45_9TELE